MGTLAGCMSHGKSTMAQAKNSAGMLLEQGVKNKNPRGKSTELAVITFRVVSE